MAQIDSLDLLAFAKGAELANRSNWADTFNQMKVDESIRQSDWADKINQLNYDTQKQALDKSALAMGWASDAHTQAKDVMQFSADLDRNIITGSMDIPDVFQRAEKQAGMLEDAIKALDPTDPAFAQKYGAIKSKAQHNAAMYAKSNPTAAQQFAAIAGGSFDKTIEADNKKKDVESQMKALLSSSGLGNLSVETLPLALMLMQNGFLPRPAAATPAATVPTPGAPIAPVATVPTMPTTAPTATDLIQRFTAPAPTTGGNNDAWATIDNRRQPLPVAPSDTASVLDMLLRALSSSPANKPFASPFGRGFGN